MHTIVSNALVHLICRGSILAEEKPAANCLQFRPKSFCNDLGHFHLNANTFEPKRVSQCSYKYRKRPSHISRSRPAGSRVRLGKYTSFLYLCGRSSPNQNRVGESARNRLPDERIHRRIHNHLQKTFSIATRSEIRDLRAMRASRV